MKIKVKYSLRPTSFLTKKTVPEKMGSFLFLGSLASNSCKDMKRRISLAAIALGNIKKMCGAEKDRKTLKVRLFHALIMLITLYAAKS